MRSIGLLTTVVVSCLLFTAGSASAQRDTTARRDTTRAGRARLDSLARADSVTRADSIALVRELERLQGDSSGRRGPVGSQPGGSNPTLLPSISAIGDVVFDASPNRSTLESGSRADIREVEVAIQAAVDPYFTADFILGANDLERLSIEEAYITSSGTLLGFALRLGRFHMPIGKQHTTHRAELQTIEYPHVIQRFLSPDAAKGTGAYLSRIFAPFGFYQELQATAVDHFGGEEEGEVETEQPPNATLKGLGYSARLRNYFDVSEASNVEVSASAATQRRAQPVRCSVGTVEETPCPGFSGPAGTIARQSLAGVDVTFRWRPLQQGLYKSFIMQAEFLRQFNERDPDLPVIDGVTVSYDGPSRDFDGLYVFARYQLARRRHIGARFDWLEDPERDGAALRAGSAYLQFFPSEFTKFVAAFERQFPSGERARSRVLLQGTFSVGPHRPHPF